MSRIVYVNGDFVPEEDGKVSIFDRGFLFADGVYEVSTVIKGRLVDNDAHLSRLKRSLNELSMTAPATDAEIVDIQEQLIARNDLEEGIIYLQVTRGAADRDFAYPKDAKSTLIMFTQARSVIDNAKADSGISVITLPDLRWKRRDIKTVGLLASAMAKQAAAEAGCDDAWFVEDGYVTEGSSNNAFIVTDDGTLVTRQLGTDILHGITRAAILRLAEEDAVTIVERRFTIEEARKAREAFITSASTFLFPVVQIDGDTIGDGKPGPVAKLLRQHYIDAARAAVAG